MQKLSTPPITKPFPLIPKLDTSRNTLRPLKEYFAIGFDVDHCLVRNRVKEIFPLLCNCLYKVLVEERGYPQSMFEFNTFERNFFMNGLVIDLRNANILKLGEGKQVLRAYFGYRRLTQEEIEKEYGTPPTFDSFDPMTIFTNDYACYLSFFDCYYPLVFAKMVEHKRKGKDYLEQEQIKEIRNDTEYAVDRNYNHCNENKYTSIREIGYYYKEILENKEKYLYKHDQMVDALRTLKDKGKTLFLLSDSHYEFVEALLNYGYGEFWKHLFDYHIVYAKKTRFFNTTDVPFKEVDFSKENKIGATTEKLQKKQMYSGGNAKLLEKNLRDAAGKHSDGRILYIGDHYSYDVLASRALKNWDSVCIMEELGGLDLGEEFDGRIWGPSHYEETPYGVVPTFWYSEMMKHADKCTKLIDSTDMLEFFYQEETENNTK